jgi:hypothetical protein|tara:strand:- start:365 stop:487 length:123 start_codon:yes stop_codon:yes gene_type:complete
MPERFSLLKLSELPGFEAFAFLGALLFVMLIISLFEEPFR